VPEHSYSTFPRSTTVVAAASLAFLATAVLPRTARADRDAYDEHDRAHFALGFDLEGAIPINIPQVNGNSVQGGGGFKIRVGEQLRFPFMRITPELGYGYDHLWASDADGSAYAWDLHRVFAGVRLGLGEILVPSVYGHVGYGWRDTSAPDVGQAGGVTYDFGVALDLHIIPHFGIGVHAEYAGIESQPDTPQWLALGLHADLVF
jgi:hypothetical protein